MRLYFVEFEKETNELYGEFYLKENVKDSPKETHNIVLTLICDKDSKKVKEFNVLKELYYEGEYTDTETITDSHKVKLKKFIKALFKCTENNNFDKNFFGHVIFEV